MTIQKLGTNLQIVQQPDGSYLVTGLTVASGEVVTIDDVAAAGATATITGTAITGGVLESEIVTGGETIIITLTGDTWVAAGTAFDAQRQPIIDGLTSAQAEATGWNAEVRDKEIVGSVVRTSDTVATITLSAAGAYAVTADETITDTIPNAALVTSGTDIVGSPTFDVTKQVSEGAPLSGIGSLTASGAKQVSEGAPLSGIGSLTASGAKQVSEGVPLSGIGSLTASGANTSAGAGEGFAPLSGFGSLTVSGTKTSAQGSSPLSAVGSIVLVGTKKSSSSMTIGGVATIISAGFKGASGSAPLSAIGSITAGGERGIETGGSSAPLSGIGSLTVSGVKKARAPPISFTSIGTISLTGIKLAIGSAPLTGIGSLTAFGYNPTNTFSWGEVVVTVLKPDVVAVVLKPTITVIGVN